jgi:hypothetical protein
MEGVSALAMLGAKRGEAGAEIRLVLFQAAQETLGAGYAFVDRDHGWLVQDDILVSGDKLQVGYRQRGAMQRRYGGGYEAGAGPVTTIVLLR